MKARELAARFAGVVVSDALKNTESGGELVGARIEVKAAAETARGSLYAALNENPGALTDAWSSSWGWRGAVGWGCKRQQKEDKNK